jgi:hypothetical protein
MSEMFRGSGSDQDAGAPRRFRLSPSLVLTAAIPLVYIVVFGLFLFRAGDTDWDQILSFHELSLWNGKLFGIAKQWNPLMRGGMSLAGDPQVPVLSPSMILARVMDPAAAIKISCLLFLAIGGLGTWLLARDLRFDRRTSGLAAALFAGNGFILSRFSHGHVVFLGTLGLPLWIWAARRSPRAPEEAAGRANRRLLGLILGGGLFFALSTDGAPIAILLLLVWVGLESGILAWQRRSPRPILFFAGSVLLATALDAVYEFPLAANAMLFPRLRPPAFVNPLVFFWFLLLPVRGKIIPAPANGHEFSVYIGPVMAYLIVRYRREIARAWPAGDLRRMVVVSGAMLVLGLGAWRALAPWLPPGPFDLLHGLPGFKAIGIPSRFWGYLALPLALAGAAALARLEDGTTAARPRRALWAGVFLFALGFQAVSLATPFVSGRGSLTLDAKPVPSLVTRIVNVHGPDTSQAGELSPTTDLLDAYNDHDFIEGTIREGPVLVLKARERGGSAVKAAAMWSGWSRIRLEFPDGAAAGTVVVFNQNYHPRWVGSGAVAARDRAGNLCARLTRRALPGAAFELVFFDPWSELGASVSFWSALAVLSAALCLAGFPLARHPFSHSLLE